MTTKCPHCGGEINPASLLGKMTSEAKAAAARENGKKGGRPKQVPRLRPLGEEGSGEGEGS